MKTIISTIFLIAAGASACFAASVINNDSEQRTLIVTEGARQSQVVVGAGETVEFCNGGCFVTMPNGDREALKGDEKIEIDNGVGRIR